MYNFTVKHYINYSLILYLIVIFYLGMLLIDFKLGTRFIPLVLAQQCPSNTTVGINQATLVGEVTDTGGDPNLEVWFRYGLFSSVTSETTHQSKNGPGLFCSTIFNLNPCTTYYYQAIARNSGGTSYGDIKSFTTQCINVTTDLKVNNSDGPITLTYGNNITLSWTSQNAVSCYAFGDWTGTKSITGSEVIQLNQVKIYTFRLTCTDNYNNSSTDSVQVQVNIRLPTVITKPAVVTF